MHWSNMRDTLAESRCFGYETTESTSETNKETPSFNFFDIQN